MLKALFSRLFGPKSYTRVGYVVWNSQFSQYQYGVAGSRVFLNKSDEDIKTILQNKYGGELDVFVITARWTE